MTLCVSRLEAIIDCKDMKIHANYKQILKPAHWLANQLRYNLERCSDRKNVNRTRSNRYGRYSTTKNLFQGARVWQKNTSRIANNPRLHIFTYSDTYKTKRIFKKKATRRANVHNHFHYCGNWNVPSFLLTKDVKLDYPSNKRSDKPSFPSGNARPRLFSLRVYAKAGRRRNVSMEDLRGSRVVAVHTDYETLKSRSMMHDKCFY